MIKWGVGKSKGPGAQPHVFKHVLQNPSDSKLAQIYNGSAFASGFTLSQISRSTTSISSTATPSATPTNQVVSPTPDSNNQNENSAPAPAKVSTATKVGVGVGVGVGVPLLAALSATLFLWSREKKRGRELQQRAAAGVGQEPPFATAQGGYKEGYGAHGSSRVHEMPGRLGDDGIKEMDGAPKRREMAAQPSMKYNPSGPNRLRALSWDPAGPRKKPISRNVPHLENPAGDKVKTRGYPGTGSH
ncbi:MAG: hypothetical protein Q9212_002756 [Teloschistes hypoglaucus]